MIAGMETTHSGAVEAGTDAGGDPPSRAGSLGLLGGHPCLDFTNTSSGRGTPHRLEHLRTYGDLLAWARHAGVLPGERADALAAAAALDPAGAEQVLRRAVALREALYAALSAHLDGAAPRPDDLRAVEAEWGRAAAHRRLVPGGTGAAWTWDEGEGGAPAALDSVLRPLAAWGAELLTAPEALARVGRCAARDCGWLFVDRTKNRSRRWCRMSDCGNRQKARRWTETRRRSRAGP
jgi:predicted RNA-binding Zn ribbon-like protein